MLVLVGRASVFLFESYIKLILENGCCTVYNTQSNFNPSFDYIQPKDYVQHPGNVPLKLNILSNIPAEIFIDEHTNV